MFSSDIYAKSNEITLQKHSENVLEVLNIILENDEILLKNKFNGELDFEFFKNSMSRAVFFHDFGKATEEWQYAIKKIIDGENIKTPPHAFFSGYFLKPSNTKDVFPMLAVLSHHSLMTNNSFKHISVNVNLYEDYIEELSKLKNFNLEKFDDLGSYKNYLIRMIESTNNMDNRSLYKNTLINLSFKRYYCYYLSYLTLCDNIASFFEKNYNTFDKNQIIDYYPSCNHIYEMIKNIDKNLNLSSIQKKIIDVTSKKNNLNAILMEAPCGEGKTLASLLFARSLFKNNKINRIIFTLPTQTTSNSMYKEFNETYNIPKKNIGIYHSEVLSFLLNETDNQREVFDDKFHNVTYSKTFNISTIDHLLLSLVNGYKYAPRSFGNLQNSLVIIDELHYYEQYTLILIEVLCEILRYLKIPHIIMSATIPKFIKEKFDEKYYLQIKSNGCDVNDIEKNPFKFKYHDEVLLNEDGFLSEAAKRIIEGNIENNIGIIVNTVKKSQEIYEELMNIFPEKQVLLYNARFMKKDRPIKEEIIRIFSKSLNGNITSDEKKLIEEYGFDINQNMIFIGTQVAEISLNISFDVILSDLSPLDSLIQRGGRLHRKQSFNNSVDCSCKQCNNFKSKHEYIFHVFNTGKYCIPYYTKNDEKGNCLYKKNIIENTKNEIIKSNNFTFNKSIKMMDKVYEEKSFSKEFKMIKKDFERIIKEDLIFGGKSYDENREKGLRIETRDFKYSTIHILPSIVTYEKEEINSIDFINKIFEKYACEDRISSTGFQLISNYLINVPLNYYLKNEGICYSIRCHKFYILSNNNYSFEKGLFIDDETLF